VNSKSCAGNEAAEHLIESSVAQVFDPGYFTAVADNPTQPSIED
jgi:hypothetical protein